MPPKRRQGRSSSTWQGPGSPTVGTPAPSRPFSKSTTCDPVLREISEIVHDADLMEDKFGRPESDGLDAVIRGMQLALPNDEVLTLHTDTIFDGLYAYLRRETL